MTGLEAGSDSGGWVGGCTRCVIFQRCAFNGSNSAAASCFLFTSVFFSSSSLGLVKERRRGKLAKLVQISLGQPEQPELPANHLLSAHKRRISGSQVKGIWAHKKGGERRGFEGLVTYWKCSCADAAPRVLTPCLCVLRS